MTWRRAPLYVSCHDLAVWLVAELASWPVPESCWTAERTARHLHGLVEDVAEALTFPDRREARRRSADLRVVRLRVVLRIAESSGFLTARCLRYVAAELDAIGRMIGGWERSARRRSASKETGAGAPRPEARGARRQLLEHG